MVFITQGKTNWKFLLIIVILATIVGGGVLYYLNLQDNIQDENIGCIQVITYAKDPDTEECKEFPNPCVVPVGWEGCSLIKDETADWQTYRNEEYGFEFKYPSDFATYKTYGNEMFIGKEIGLYLVLYGSSTIDTLEKRAELENLNGSSFAPYLNTVYLSQEFKEIYIQGRKAIEVLTIFNDTPPGYYESKPSADWGSGEHREIFFSCKEYICSIRTHFDKENKYQNEILFNQILSTFRFLE